MLAVFSLSLFVSATLLFLVQPMFARMVLPLLGGSPAVWNTCMVFYQAALLAGYLYAHAAPRWLGVRRQAALHLALLFLIILTLPIGLASGWAPSATGSPLVWLLKALLVSVGLPFFIISATAPLLQKWFAHSGHASAGDPYFLYGASNLGSLTALLGYPLLVEPYLRLAHQAWVWAAGYLTLLGLISACAVMLWRAPAAGGSEGDPSPKAAPPAPEGDPPTAGQRLWWVLLAFAPSSLLLGVTTYLSTDIAAVPLLWVIPLAIYLLTFVLVFARRPLLPHRLMVWLEPYLIITLGISMILTRTGSWPLYALHLVAFLLIAMVCHGELMQARPPAAHLTEFYLWMSVGGVLGGIFNALVAPVTFSSVIEYPLVIVVASLLRPARAAAAWRPYRGLLDVGLPGALLGVLALLVKVVPSESPRVAWTVIFCLAGLVVWTFRNRPLRFGLAVGAVLLAGGIFTGGGQGQVLHAERNFFGRLQVRGDEEGKFHVLIHGTTMHGAQSWQPGHRREPLTYYHRKGPVGQLFAGRPRKNPLEQVAVIGLGAGTVACYGKPGQHFTFYEIDPAVERLARDPRYFTYLKDSPADIRVVLGDGRLSLKQAPDAFYNLIILDAFSSDAIPVHLLTREALRLYLAKLKPGGLIALHITNRYLDLKPVIGALARDAGLSCMVQEYAEVDFQEDAEKICASIWVVLARDIRDLGSLVPPRWVPLPARPGEAVWTDDFSNILAVTKGKFSDLEVSLTLFLDDLAKGWRTLTENLISYTDRKR